MHNVPHSDSSTLTWAVCTTPSCELQDEVKAMLAAEQCVIILPSASWWGHPDDLCLLEHSKSAFSGSNQH